LFLIALTSALSACHSLSYPNSEWHDDRPGTLHETSTDPVARSGEDSEAPSLAGNPNGLTETDLGGLHASAEVEETELGWSDLIKIAREHQRRSEFAEAEQRLEQASLLVIALPPTHARRQATFGIRARLAQHLALAGEIVRADALADELFAEAEAEPEIAGPSLVSLAITVEKRRTLIAQKLAQEALGESGGIPSLDPSTRASQLRILIIGLAAAQKGTADRERFAMSIGIAEGAYYLGRLDVARIAIDQALNDIQLLAPTNLAPIAELLVRRSQIAKDSGDYPRAVADATRANQLFEELGANQSMRGRGEAALAEAFAKSGDIERASAIAAGAKARLDQGEAIGAYTRRTILGAFARVEAEKLSPGRTRAFYDEALAVPEGNSDADRHLLRELQRERSALSALDAATETSPSVAGGARQIQSAEPGEEPIETR